MTRTLVIATAILTILVPSASASTEDSFRRGMRLLGRAASEYGGREALRASHSMVIEAEGTLDRGARHQGHTPDAVHASPYRETIVIDEPNERLGYEHDLERYDGVREWWRFVYEQEDLFRFVDPFERMAFASRERSVPETRRRIARAAPPIVLRDALASASSVREIEGGAVVVALDGELVALSFDPATGRLAKLSYMVDETLDGDVPVEWSFLDYRDVDGIGPMPSRVDVRVSGRLLKSVRWNVRGGEASKHRVFSIPDGIDPPAVPDPLDSGGSAPPREPRVLDRGHGARQVAGIRSGFNVAFFEFDAFVMVFEAPAGWLELHEIPARNFEKGATSSSVSRTLIEIVKREVPDKPIRYVVLSHVHGDHAGGVRAFIAEGATVITTKRGAVVVETAATRTLAIHPDRLSGAPVRPKIEVVEGRRVVSDGTTSVEILEVPDNPHAEGLLVLHQPANRAVFVADLFHPVRIERFPLKSELPLQVSFVDWLDRVGIVPEKIYAVHGGVGGPEHLEKIRSLSRGKE